MTSCQRNIYIYFLRKIHQYWYNSGHMSVFMNIEFKQFQFHYILIGLNNCQPEVIPLIYWQGDYKITHQRSNFWLKYFSEPKIKGRDLFISSELTDSESKLLCNVQPTWEGPHGEGQELSLCTTWSLQKSLSSSKALGAQQPNTAQNDLLGVSQRVSNPLTLIFFIPQVISPSLLLRIWTRRRDPGGLLLSVGNAAICIRCKALPFRSRMHRTPSQCSPWTLRAEVHFCASRSIYWALFVNASLWYWTQLREQMW